MMELLGSLSLEQLHSYSWGIAAGVLLVLGVYRWRSLHWTVVGSVMLFAALNAGAGIYVLSTVGDSRWSAGEESSLSAPSFAETPVVGGYLVPLDSALHAVVGGVNEFMAFKQALPIALEFLATSGIALLVSFPLAIIAAIVSFIVARRHKANFEKFRATVDQLKVELEQVKFQIAASNFAVPAYQAVDDATDVLPRLTRGE
ncbi:hypothetical protein [Paeniglutamicibacter psychrophenolicus]|uniref:hypothetical protein n=1 Tax=Paeniglutamicibacter psychrophenolicus TaxID=257454 RepID=UPI002781476D|nr:hypothetical protein [Paeniglutamicibacter psychrophenolicus]MDQ0095022.1 hypothetical protein [Paeniglutamicibacter psychrophenolicus]